MDIPRSTSVRRIGDKQIQSFSRNRMYYVESIPQGKAVFEWILKSDTTFSNQLFNLSFSEDHKNWGAYIGDFGGNIKYNRLVFAYKYFKRILFYDLKNKTSRVISFEQKDIKKGDNVSMQEPTNITHYWGMSTGEDYLYVLYSGRTPIQVTKELNTSSGYIYVEQYDWNGNPIRKFKLDHWGYFCVDEGNSKIYLVSTTEVQPFYSFDLPK